MTEGQSFTVPPAALQKLLMTIYQNITLGFMNQLVVDFPLGSFSHLGECSQSHLGVD